MQGSFDGGEQEGGLVPAGGIELVLHVECAEARLLHQQVLLCEAEPAGVRGWALAGGPGNEGPGDLVPPFFALEVSHILAQAGVLSLLDVVEAGSVVIAPGLPWGFGSAEVGLHLLGPGVDHLVHQLGSLWRKGFHFGLVDDV